MQPVSYKTVKKQYMAWKSAYEESNQRGCENVAFVLAGDQWKEDVLAQRRSANKESLTLNQCLKHERRLKQQARELVLSLNITPITNKFDDDAEQTNAYKLLLLGIVLSSHMETIFGRAFDKCAEYGYSFLEVNYERENQETLSLHPVVRLHKDPSIGFWDKSAIHPCKIDGRFCGLFRTLSKDDFLAKYPKYKTGDYGWLKDKNNEVIDYWYRDYQDEEFVLLENGSYKRRDLLTDEDVLEQDDSGVDPLVRKAPVCRIYFQRFCNERVIQQKTLFPTDDLPIPYHFACTVFIPDRGEETFPLMYHLQDAQRFHNYLQSQIATVAKNSSSEKWLFSQQHIMTQQQEEQAKNINKNEGGFKFGGDIATIRRERPSELPMSMVQMGQLSKQEIEELAGNMADGQGSDQTVVSGVALAQITHNIGLVNVDAIGAHVEFINTVGQLLRQMIPRLYTDERTLIVDKKDGTGESITINELLPTGDVKNSIKNINHNFYYEIIASPSSVMEKENTLKALQSVYMIDPTAFQKTGDIYMRNLATPDAPELERRIAATIDPDLIQYSQGYLSLKEFQQKQQQKAQMQLQQQMQMMAQAPESQLAQAEQMKAQAAQFDSQTKRTKVVGDLENKRTDQQLKAAETLNKNEREQMQHAIDIARLHAEAQGDSNSPESTQNETAVY